MSTEPGDMAQELNAAHEELEQLTDLLKKVRRIEANDGGLAYFNDTQQRWVYVPARKPLAYPDSLLEALRVLTAQGRQAAHEIKVKESQL